MVTRPLSVACIGFKRVLKDPTSWTSEADNLRDAADLVHEAYAADWKVVEQCLKRKRRGEGSGVLPGRLGLYKVAFLLLGLANENLLKAMLLGNNVDTGSDNEIKWPDNGHDQRKLASNAGLGLTAEEDVLLGLLSEFVLWAGRYPLPKKEKHLDQELDSSGDQWAKAVALFDRLRSTLHDRPKV
ncbi:MAG: hypothetical protein ABSH20_01350 [Tepidisphaeraceae bacterium]|jgi:hypothetical protein